MTRWFMNLKPGVSPRTHLLCAALLWTIIGLFLIQRGIGYLMKDQQLLLIFAAILLGWLKSRYVLDRSAERGVERIRHFADNTCIGAVYSWKTWMLVIAMMVLGLLVRNSTIPAYIVGVVCVTIGWALIRSSRFSWKAWFTCKMP